MVHLFYWTTLIKALQQMIRNDLTISNCHNYLYHIYLKMRYWSGGTIVNIEHIRCIRVYGVPSQILSYMVMRKCKRDHLWE